MLKDHLVVSNKNFKRGQFQNALNDVNTVLEDKITLYHKFPLCFSHCWVIV